MVPLLFKEEVEMSILTGKQIIECVKDGEIEIDPFDIKRINPNSYNLRIGDCLKVYSAPYWNYPDSIKHPQDVILDTRKKNEVVSIKIPEDGFMLKPGTLYLGSTQERTYSKKYIPIIDGRSSTGRLGIQVHMTAGFGDLGFNGVWTLEITVVHKVIIYPHDELCQVYFETPYGDYSYQYNGRYQNQDSALESKFEEEKKGTILDV